MNKIIFCCIYTSILLGMTNHALGEEVIVRTPNGDCITIDVSEETTFFKVIEEVESYLSSNLEVQIPAAYTEGAHRRPFLLDFMFGTPAESRKLSSPRDYAAPVSLKEKEDISYIVTNLASNSWTQLLNKKSSLKKAGDRVDHVHPLRFLMCIFTDEELKGGVNAIRSRGGKIWKEFFSGLSSSLDEESQANNMRADMVDDFAKNVGINISLIQASIQESRWSDFMYLLIDNIPRNGNPGRYDM